MSVRLRRRDHRGPRDRSALARRRPWRRDDAARARCCGSSTPAPSTSSQRGFPRASRSSPPRTARPRRRRWRPRSSAPSGGSRGTAPVRTSSPASPLRSSPGRRADLGLFEVDEGALPEALARTRPRAVALGNLFRDQLDRYGELEIVAERWRAAVAQLPPSATLVVNADDPVVGDLATRADAALRFGLDDPRQARPALQHAADSKYCVRCGAPYEYAAIYVGHLGDYRCPRCDHHRPALDLVATDIELRGLHSSRFRLVTPHGAIEIELALPGLYNVYNAVAAAALSLAVGASLEDVRAGLSRFSAAFGRFERIPAGGKSVVLLLVKNPAGANEVVRTLEIGVPPVLVVALNDAIADGQDVSWIWDVDFEPLLEHAGLVIATGDRAAELGLRMTYGGLPAERLEVIPVARGGARSRARARRGGHGARRSFRRTRRCSRCAGSSPSAASCARTGRSSAREDPRRASLPRVPEHLRGSREHRRPHAPSCAARSRARGALDRPRRRRSIPPRTTSSTSAAARIVSRGSSHPTSRRRARRCGLRTRAASRCSPCAAATSSSAAATAAATARSCPAPGSSRTRRSPATCG